MKNYKRKSNTATAVNEPIYGYPKGFKYWIKRKLGFKVEKIYVCTFGHLQILKDVFWYNPRLKMQEFVDTYVSGVKII